MWHVSSRSGVATLRTAIHLSLTYLLPPTLIVHEGTLLWRYQGLLWGDRFPRLGRRKLNALNVTWKNALYDGPRTDRPRNHPR